MKLIKEFRDHHYNWDTEEDFLVVQEIEVSQPREDPAAWKNEFMEGRCTFCEAAGKYY